MNRCAFDGGRYDVAVGKNPGDFLTRWVGLVTTFWIPAQTVHLDKACTGRDSHFISCICVSIHGRSQTVLFMTPCKPSPISNAQLFHFDQTYH